MRLLHRNYAILFISKTNQLLPFRGDGREVKVTKMKSTNIPIPICSMTYGKEDGW